MVTAQDRFCFVIYLYFTFFPITFLSSTSRQIAASFVRLVNQHFRNKDCNEVAQESLLYVFLENDSITTVFRLFTLCFVDIFNCLAIHFHTIVPREFPFPRFFLSFWSCWSGSVNVLFCFFLKKDWCCYLHRNGLMPEASREKRAPVSFLGKLSL